MTREFELQVIKRPNNVFSEKEQEGYIFEAKQSVQVFGGTISQLN